MPHPLARRLIKVASELELFCKGLAMRLELLPSSGSAALPSSQARALLLSAPLMYASGAVVLQVVSERASGAAAAQVLAGVPRSLLWTSHLLWDVGVWWALSAALVLLLCLGGVRSLTGGRLGMPHACVHV